MKKILFVLFLLIIGCSTYATDWLQIGPKTWVDLETLDVKKYNSNTIVTAWFKDLNPGNWELMNNKKVWYNLTQQDFDCTNNKINAKNFYSYDVNGNLIDSYQFKYAQWENLVPDSVGYYKYKIMCRFNEKNN